MENTMRVLLQKCDEFLKDKKYLESWKRKRPSINCGSGKKTCEVRERVYSAMGRRGVGGGDYSRFKVYSLIL